MQDQTISLWYALPIMIVVAGLAWWAARHYAGKAAPAFVQRIETDIQADEDKLFKAMLSHMMNDSSDLAKITQANAMADAARASITARAQRVDAFLGAAAAIRSAKPTA